MRRLFGKNRQKKEQPDQTEKRSVQASGGVETLGDRQVAKTPTTRRDSSSHQTVNADNSERKSYGGTVNQPLPTTGSPAPVTTDQSSTATANHLPTVTTPPASPPPPPASSPPPASTSTAPQGIPSLPLSRRNSLEADEFPKTVKVEDLEQEDVVIAIMGPTGAGKSTFIHAAGGLGSDGIGHSLKSCTSEVLAFRLPDEVGKRRVVLVDTPGFDDTYKSDLDILNMISDWLNKSYKSEKLLSAILYFHRITDNRMAGTPLKNLRLFRKLCGTEVLDTVYLTTTMWDEVDLDVGRRRLDELKKDYWKEMIDQGAQIAPEDMSDDNSKKGFIQGIIDEIERKADQPRAVLLQEEMGKMEKELKETSAGKELFSELDRLVAKQTELLRRIAKERKAASDGKMTEDLQREYEELRKQMEDKLRQMQELKVSRLKNLGRLLFPWKRD